MGRAGRVGRAGATTTGSSRSSTAALEFLFKHHLVHTPGYHLGAFPDGGEPRTWLWWEGTLPARERLTLDPEELDADLRGFVAAHQPEGSRRARRRRRPGA